MTRHAGARAALAAGVLGLAWVGPGRLDAQADPRLRNAVALAQSGQLDSARTLVDRLLAALPPTDSVFPEALYTAGLVAADAPTVMRYLQRVIVEYDRSPWADDALLRLTQLHFAQRDAASTVQAAERMRRDYPDSPLFPQAAFPAARAYFDLRDETRGCALIRIALAGAGDNVELRNQVNFYAARCPPEGGPAPDSGPTARPAAPRFAVQVLAVRGTAQVDEMLTRLRGMGYTTRVVRDTTGLFKVWVGPYPTREAAQQAQQQIRTRLGGQPFIVEER
ncbi:MAG TPA: SPOR domain-containing protein [Gemmatimonadales bacterium]|nr:SPOR domain-containing protein [Gemmatimonadales bacterium]